MINEGSVEHMSDARGHSDLCGFLPTESTQLLSLSSSNDAWVHFHRSSFEFNLSGPDFPPARRLLCKSSTLVFFFFNFHVSVENFRLRFLTWLKTLWAKTTLKLNFPCKHVCALVRNHRLRNHLAQRQTLACCCCLPHLCKHFWLLLQTTAPSPDYWCVCVY